MHDSHWWNLSIDIVQAIAIPIAAGALFLAWRNRRKTNITVTLERDFRAEQGYLCPEGLTEIWYSLHKVTLTNNSDISSGILRFQMKYEDSDSAFPQATVESDGDKLILRAPGEEPKELITSLLGRTFLRMPINIPAHESVEGWIAIWIPAIQIEQFHSKRKWLVFRPNSGGIFQHEIIRLSRPTKTKLVTNKN